MAANTLHYWDYLKLLWGFGLANSWGVTWDIMAAVAVALAYLVWQHPRWEEVMKKLSWQLPIMMFLVVAMFHFFFVSPYVIFEVQQREIEAANKAAAYLMTSEELKQTTIIDKVFNLSDLARDGNLTVTNRVFEKSIIRGPAVVILRNNTRLVNTDLGAPTDKVLVSSTNEVRGAIILDNVLIRNSVLKDISIIDTPDNIAILRNSLK